MKCYLILIPLLILLSCNSATDKTSDTGTSATTADASNDTANYTTVQWLDSAQNLGVITHGETKEISFRFRNSGNKPLMIISASPGCGCTVADYPKEPIPPGGEGVIKAGYDTKNQHIGAFHKSISVVTNTSGNANHSLVFSGEIISVEKQEVKRKGPNP